MFSSRWFVILVPLVTCTNAAGIGKAWEVSPVQNTDNPSVLSSRPRFESSAFEVRSVSGIGRLAPLSVNREKQPTESPIEETTKESPSSAEQSGETITESVPQLRMAKELEDLESSNVFVPEHQFHDPAIEELIESSKEIAEVEALPGVWQKFRRYGRTGRNGVGHCSEVEEINENSRHDVSVLRDDRRRARREAETEMEKIVTSKNVREGRLSSPDSWSKQPLSVEFRHRTKLEEAAEDEEKSAKSTSRGLQAPHVDFVTANRRSFSENRQSRDMSLSPVTGRSYDETPVYRNTLRDRDLDAPYTPGLFYPERYRTERDYFVRGSNEPTYQQDRYREIDFDLYSRGRPAPKPKRIIYYATLPEVVRKPVDMRTYQRPYEPLTRSSSAAMANDGHYKRRVGSNDNSPRYRYYSYPTFRNYENYEQFAMRPAWNERTYGSYDERMDAPRRREADLDHASMKDTSRNEEAMLELGHERKMSEREKSREQDKLPWPVKIGTEVSVKENDRITGRKIFGQRDEYNRFRNSVRMDREREQTGSLESRN